MFIGHEASILSVYSKDDRKSSMYVLSRRLSSDNADYSPESSC